jgi:hypothetical protein
MRYKNPQSLTLEKRMERIFFALPGIPFVPVHNNTCFEGGDGGWHTGIALFEM